MELENIFKRRGYTKQEFITAVETSFSKRQVLHKLNLVEAGGNYKVFDRAVKELGLDTSHFKGQGYLSGKTHDWSKKIPIQDILIENSTYTSSFNLKNRLLSEGLLIEQCSKCGISDEWQGEHLSLHLEHKNGINNDHRIENLTLLCPNCHSQTKSYCGRNKGKYK
jgi:hypothetical protein